ncbi:MAG: tRNA (adenosine(37)-N6)-threonylcarbamoyltransferase complex ATPase subunit type 1 TsaE [Candidatus Vogelbacteria bacterium]
MGTASPWERLVHIDCYRLDRSDDLLHLGWNEIVADPNNLILVEWPERVGDLLSSSTLKIKFEVIDENSRKIIYG